MAVVTVLQCWSSNRHFSTPTECPKEQNVPKVLQKTRTRPRGQMFHCRQKGGQKIEARLQRHIRGCNSKCDWTSVILFQLNTSRSEKQIHSEFQLGRKFCLLPPVEMRSWRCISCAAPLRENSPKSFILTWTDFWDPLYSIICLFRKTDRLIEWFRLEGT